MDLETVELSRGSLLLDGRIANPALVVAGKLVKQLLELGSPAFGDQMNPAVWQVADVAADLHRSGGGNRTVSKPDALDLSAVIDFPPLGTRVVGHFVESLRFELPGRF